MDQAVGLAQFFIPALNKIHPGQVNNRRTVRDSHTSARLVRWLAVGGSYAAREGATIASSAATRFINSATVLSSKLGDGS
jgi:hypothetical protein